MEERRLRCAIQEPRVIVDGEPGFDALHPRRDGVPAFS